MTEISSCAVFATLRAQPIFRLRASRDAPFAALELRQRIRLMSPEERQMLTDLFERVRGQANAPRDRDAESLIADAIRTQPYAPYLLTQAVLLQEQALRAADQKLQELQAQVVHMQDELAHAQAQPAPGAGSFLGGLFGGGASRPAPQQPAANPNPWGGGAQQAGYASQQQGGYAPTPQQGGPATGPWGAPQPQQSGGFLKGALGAAAGVAGGMLLADSFKGLLGGGQANAAGLGGLGGLGAGAGGERVVNNYYEASKSKDDSSDDNDDDSGDQDDSDDDFSGGGDDYGDDI
jgi:hypothetical protein